MIYIDDERVRGLKDSKLSRVCAHRNQHPVSQDRRQHRERPKPEANSPKPGTTAYVAALQLLARRELSEAQVRIRLLRRGYGADDIDDAVASLKAERALDDGRVAGAMARTAVTLKRRGRRRVRLEIERAGIAPAVARQAVEETFGDLDEDALLEGALDRRRRPAKSLNEPAEFGRLYRYLVGQGFDPERVLHALTRRRS